MQLEIAIPKNKRSKYVADIIAANLPKNRMVTYEEIDAYWTKLANMCKRKTNKTAVELIREDRMSH